MHSILAVPDVQQSIILTFKQYLYCQSLRKYKYATYINFVNVYKYAVPDYKSSFKRLGTNSIK